MLLLKRRKSFDPHIQNSINKARQINWFDQENFHMPRPRFLKYNVCKASLRVRKYYLASSLNIKCACSTLKGVPTASSCPDDFAWGRPWMRISSVNTAGIFPLLYCLFLSTCFLLLNATNKSSKRKRKQSFHKTQEEKFNRGQTRHALVSSRFLGPYSCRKGRLYPPPALPSRIRSSGAVFMTAG